MTSQLGGDGFTLTPEPHLSRQTYPSPDCPSRDYPLIRPPTLRTFRRRQVSRDLTRQIASQTRSDREAIANRSARVREWVNIDSYIQQRTRGDQLLDQLGDLIANYLQPILIATETTCAREPQIRSVQKEVFECLITIPPPPKVAPPSKTV